MSDTRIRTAASSDLPAIGRLGARLVAMHHRLDSRRFLPATTGTERAYASFLGANLNKEQVVILAAERNNAVVGYSYAGVEGTDFMSLRGPAGIVYDIAVDQSVRRQGIGTLLLEATLSALKRLGAPRVLLSTAVQNSAARRLFARAGFRETMIELTRELDDAAGTSR